ncbi:MAG TPA: hypothetical protein VN519_10335 [Bryobacteraceae bacterium]|nr:hypothetical protein [Bryobacteraceae bacterium]
MSIISTMPPESASLALAGALQSFLSGPVDDGRVPRREGYAGLPPSLPDMASLGLSQAPILDVARVEQFRPLGVYTLRLDDVGTSAGIRAAELTGWRFLVGNADQNLISCTVTRQAGTGAWQLTTAYYGPQVKWVFRAKDALASLQQIQARSYELRILVIPAINVEAFWLYDPSPDAADLVAVYVDGTQYVVPTDAQPPATFLRVFAPQLQLAAASARRHAI